MVATKPRVHNHAEQATDFSVIFMLFKISRVLKSRDFKSLLNLWNKKESNSLSKEGAFLGVGVGGRMVLRQKEKSL